MARFIEHRHREGWWFLTELLIAQAKCEETPKEYAKQVKNFVDFIGDSSSLYFYTVRNKGSEKNVKDGTK